MSLYSVNKHHFICGATGSGKTTYASWEYGRIPVLAIFVNTNHEVVVEDNSDVIIHDTESFQQAKNEGHKKICLNPTTNRDIATKDVEELIAVLFAYGEKINEKRHSPAVWCYLYIDEIHEYSSKQRPSAVIDRVWKRGRRYGIVGVGMSQRPADVSHTILTQSRVHIIFNLSAYESEYFSRYKIPVFENSEAWQWLQKDYHFVVFDGLGLKKAYPIEPYA